MNRVIIYLLVPIALIVLVIAIRFLFWAINSGQYDDLDTEGQRILFDEDNVERFEDKDKLSQNRAAEKKNSD